MLTGCRGLQLFPSQCAEVLLSDEGIKVMLETLEGAKRASASGPAIAAFVIQSMLTVLLRCGSKGKSSAGETMVSKLHCLVSSFERHGDQAVAALAQQVVDLFE
jgi:hypothetical protein